MKNNLFHSYLRYMYKIRTDPGITKPIPHLNLTFMHTTVCYLQGLPIDALLIMTLCALR